VRFISFSGKSVWGRAGSAAFVYIITHTPRGVRALLFLSLPLILSSDAHLGPLRMSGAQIFSNAHDIALSGGMFYAADTVSRTARYPPSKLIAWISGRCTSTTSTTAIVRCLMVSFPSCQIRAIGSQAVEKSSPNSRGIFPT